MSSEQFSWTETTAITELESNGIPYRGGMIITTNDVQSERTTSAIRYLCSEWDYDHAHMTHDQFTERMARKFAVSPTAITDLQLRLANEKPVQF